MEGFVSTSAEFDPRLLRLGAGDNVLIATSPIPRGSTFVVNGHTVIADDDVPTGFKVAATNLTAGELAIRLGTPIGRTTRDIGVGQIVHTHNLASLYLRTHGRGEE
jgi:altronate hydrolase